MTKIEELKEQIDEIENDLKIHRIHTHDYEDCIKCFLINKHLYTLKDWIQDRQEIMKMINNKIENSYYNYKLTKPNDEELDELNVYYILIKKLKEIKEEIEKWN